MIKPRFRKQSIVCTHNNSNDKVNDNSSNINIRSYYLLNTCYEIGKITSLRMIEVQNTLASFPRYYLVSFSHLSAFSHVIPGHVSGGP